MKMKVFLLMKIFIHILVGLKKEDKYKTLKNEYIRILGFNKNGKVNVDLKEYFSLPFINRIDNIIEFNYLS